MPYVTTSDGTEIYYTEGGRGRPVVFSHGWPLCSDAWQVELKLFADAGYRAIAHDRRGHGRSTKTYQGNDMETYAAGTSGSCSMPSTCTTSCWSGTRRAAARSSSAPPRSAGTG